jgi:hypothetical protein
VNWLPMTTTGKIVRDGCTEKMPPISRKEAVDAAVEFVAMRPDGPQRILAHHYPTESGICAGCLASATRYPCQAARIAEAARQHPIFRSHGVSELVPPIRRRVAARQSRPEKRTRRKRRRRRSAIGQEVQNV